MIYIKDLIKELEELKEKGYTELYVTVSDGFDSHDGEFALNEGVLTDGTKVVDLDVFATFGAERW
jgi:hypothetical protein